jgi:hypothetical protein
LFCFCSVGPLGGGLVVEVVDGKIMHHPKVRATGRKRRCLPSVGPLGGGMVDVVRFLPFHIYIFLCLSLFIFYIYMIIL